MPCYRCGARQTDPAKGASPWRRGVRGAEQVLVCPDCQRVADWTADLERCPVCGSTALVRRLGRTECRGCESSSEARLEADPVAARSAFDRPGGSDDKLAEEVAAAIDRVLGRVPVVAPPRNVIRDTRWVAVDQ